ncbi:MAG: type II toxin-antitoxin system VapC family toxin [Deltaproteobacteria bacterium]|nr:type II toxin-antitoxin system VapC family toxin [Deltaproteobacteria bacterium]
MNSLIDTHTFLWSVSDPDRLGKKARTVLEDPNNSIWISVVSFWEISLKHAVGKLDLVNVLPEAFPDIAKQMQFEVLNLSALEAATFYKLPKMSHKDPFDRLIIWQAIQQKLPIISKDKQVIAYKELGLKVIW